MTTPNLPAHVTLDEAAAYLGISKTTLRAFLDSGELPAIRLGGRPRLIRIARRDLERFADRHHYLDV